VSRTMAWLSKLLHVLRHAEELCLVTGVLTIATLNLANVGSRALLGRSIASVEELSRFAMVWITFIGLGHAAGRGRHIRMTALYDALPERTRKQVLTLTSFLTSALCFYLCGLALSYVFGTVRTLGAVSPVLEVPKWIVFLAAPLGAGLAGLQYALAGVRNLCSEGRYVSFTDQDGYEDNGAAL
jgi:C4-dicarboxylate transporter, DctQ subunit